MCISKYISIQPTQKSVFSPCHISPKFVGDWDGKALVLLFNA